MNFRLDKGGVPCHLASPFDCIGPLSPTQHNSPHMWPVQTLTLLLCLTDDEQLFADRKEEPLPPVTIEVVLPNDEVEPEAAVSVLVPEA